MDILKLIGLILILTCTITYQDTSTEVTELAKNISEKFKALADKVLKPTTLAGSLELQSKAISDKDAIAILGASKVSSEIIVTKTSGVVVELHDTTQALLDADVARNITRKYLLECNSSSTNYEYYFRSKKLDNGSETDKVTCDTQKLLLTQDPIVDNVPTSREKSTVHIPTNVYHAAQDIQEVANITDDLDKQYTKFKTDVNVQWQYFCSKTGFFKIYPGVQWYIQIADSEATPTMVDFFDCRSEQWYLESTSYSKKMMIIVDKSGSMKGRRRIIANHTVSEILNTLTENDFFNIILFNKTFLYADNTTNDKLVQGTAKNKKYMMKELAENFKPGGIAEYEVGIVESLRLLEEDRKKEGAAANKFNYMLMIVSDGAPSNYKKEFDIYRNKTNALPFRVFTYLIGQGITEEAPVKQMACENYGFAVQIATLADVKENVQKYLNVVARPTDKQPGYSVWTGVQQNQILSKKLATMSNSPASVSVRSPSDQASGINFNSSISNATTPPSTKKVEITKIPRIKMYVSSSKAVYSIREKANNSLFGAVGVDVPITDFLNTAPFWKLGVKGYLFGVTNNGFVIFHPRFRPQYESFMKYFYRNVDISEVELDVKTKLTNVQNDQVVDSKIRDEVLKFTESAPKSIGSYTVFDVMDNFVTAFPVTREYFLTTIKDTSYKFGLAVSTDFKVPFYFESVNKAKAFANDPKLEIPTQSPSPVKDFKGTMLTYFEYCKAGKKYLLQNPLSLLKRIASGDVKCDDSNENDIMYYKSLLKELKETEGYHKQWEDLKLKSNVADNVQQIFSMHHFGTTRYFNYENLSYENFLVNHDEGLRDPLYVETILNADSLSNNNFMTVKPLPNEEIKKDIADDHIVFSATMPLFKSEAYAGIVGAQVAQKKFFNFTDVDIWNDRSKYNIYVVTSTGLVLHNNIDIRHTGEMLKDLDCSLMEVLVDKMSIFQKQDLYDLQGLCPNQQVHTESFANRLLDPFNRLFKFSIWVMYEFIILVQNFSFSSMYWSLSSAEEFLSANQNYLPSPAILTPNDNNDDSSNDPNTNKNDKNDSDDDTPLSPPPTPVKSRRQHEKDVKNMFQEEADQCISNHDQLTKQAEFSGCIQKAVSNICRQDKAHQSAPKHLSPTKKKKKAIKKSSEGGENVKSTNQSTSTDIPNVNATESSEVNQETKPIRVDNAISHCATACDLLQSEYPNIWAEQDDCKRSLYLCRQIIPAFSAIFGANFSIDSNPNLTPVTSSRDDSSKLPRIPDSPPYRPEFDHQSQVADAKSPDAQTYYVYKKEIENNGNDRMQNDYNRGTKKIFTERVCTKCSAKVAYVTGIENTNLLLVVLEKTNPGCRCECKNSFATNMEIRRDSKKPLKNPERDMPEYSSKFNANQKLTADGPCTDSASSIGISKILLIFFIISSIFIFY